MSNLNAPEKNIASYERSKRVTARYTWLPFVATLLKILGKIAICFWVIEILSTMYTSWVTTSRFVDSFHPISVPGLTIKLLTMLGLFLPLLFQFVGILLMFAASELIGLLMDIEDHARRTADAATGKLTGTTPRAE